MLNVPAISPTLLSFIMAQATVVLIACSIVLNLLRDLYEDRQVIVGVAGEFPRTKPMLDTKNANRLRWFLRWFLRLLVAFYVLLALGIALVEFVPDTDNFKDVFFTQTRIAGRDFSLRISLQDVYVYATRGHFAIVVVVGAIVACMGRIRDDEARRRWRPDAT